MTDKGKLYVVATPIGNLEDITLRAIRILKEVDLIGAEDTRHTKKLLNHFSISTPLISYYREKEKQRAAEFMDRIISGENIAIVSDAGTPGISDPGAIVVQLAHENDVEVIPVPGPSAITSAVSCSGISENRFLFCGFAPSKGGQRKTFLKQMAAYPFPFVLYESPHRFTALVRDILDTLGDRRLFMARELTKAYEELLPISATRLLNRLQNQPPKGEFVLIVLPAEKKELSDEEILAEITRQLAQQPDEKTGEMSKTIARKLGIKKSRVYQIILSLDQPKR